MNLGSKIGKVMLVLALSFSLGAHWAFLQVVAWAGMLISYSQTSGFIAGVSATFDGKHPCPLCLVVQKGRQDEQKSSPQNSPTPLEDEDLIGILTANPLFLRSAVDFQPVAAFACYLAEWSRPPPKRPPRAWVARLKLQQCRQAQPASTAPLCPKVVLPRSDSGAVAFLVWFRHRKAETGVKNGGGRAGGRQKTAFSMGWQTRGRVCGIQCGAMRRI